MAPKFGTSGLRGLVTELTDALVADYTRAFLAACPHNGTIHLGWDLRDSSPRIADAVAGAAKGEGVNVVPVGEVPTPALALAAMAGETAAIMVTGSHIPADRNGLKFYVPTGEITKGDEGRITAALGREAKGLDAAEEPRLDLPDLYAARYVKAFGPAALAGLRVGVYEHSSVARDILTRLVTALGGEAVPLARSDSFVPVDTEAVDADTREMFAGWCAEHGLSALISTDGDADRPMVTDDTGRIVPGDVLGPLTAEMLGAQVIVTPVSSNTAVSRMGFGRVDLTRIGSPFVIAGMEAVRAADPAAQVVGYEANGGFLLGFEAAGPAGPLPPLMTRDSVLPIVAPLARAVAEGTSLSELVATLPARFTAADRLTGIESAASGAFIEAMTEDPARRAAFFDTGSDETAMDTTDGLRVTFAGGEVVHLRPSGNAPEFRCYTEADSPERAQALLERHLAALRGALG
ncbi:phosphomannomutase [Maritimibacter sp. UBA3975]|uniref:phosphomannomutase n=1 Tax=Maritimibacter sp. UBA3975 TaxID=1946833 RepID=UPI000C0A3AC4|nr:phosphomannomutase [Maritimibacter sp. UBA3975]MAM62290.1 phosphomannomutase [Maritimibacter sp.]|tara:strand:+ start:4585 stop:5973 length:1389 start_codon:yes stop_codon:yes gene_type:complete